MPPPKSTYSPLIKALSAHRIKAEVVDLDHYRNGVAVDTDYVISVQPADDGNGFRKFLISKTYHAFRQFAAQLKAAADSHTSKTRSSGTLPADAVKVAKLCEDITQLVESQKTSYLGKVNFAFVKVMTKQRSQVINDVLDEIITCFPESIGDGSNIKTLHPLLSEIASIVDIFFLTDHCEAVKEIEAKEKEKSVKKEVKLAISAPSHPEGGDGNPLVPLSVCSRRPDTNDSDLLSLGDAATLHMDLERKRGSSYNATFARARGQWGLSNHISPTFVVLAAVVLYVIHKKYADVKVTMDLDCSLLVVFAAFSMGWNAPHPEEKPPRSAPGGKKEASDKSGRLLLRRSMKQLRHSMLSSPDLVRSPDLRASLLRAEVLDDPEDEDTVSVGELIILSPLNMFPENAKIGSEFNCWSEPPYDGFHIRGPNYLVDKKKIPSGPYLLLNRGADLFLTDTCPENVGSNSSILGGLLREKPTFIINFRLPWGVFVLYFEIPERFLPFVRAGYENGFDESNLPDLTTMTAGDRAACRFFKNDGDYKNKALKLVPLVVDGPWVVKAAVGKPAIISKAVPTEYVYQPASADGKKALYLEADFDIAASSAARGILSVTRSYTNILTLDLGWVIQGAVQDELPEQMLASTRIHGLDPLTASPLPPMKNAFIDNLGGLDGKSESFED